MAVSAAALAWHLPTYPGGGANTTLERSRQPDSNFAEPVEKPFQWGPCSTGQGSWDVITYVADPLRELSPCFVASTLIVALEATVIDPV